MIAQMIKRYCVSRSTTKEDKSVVDSLLDIVRDLLNVEDAQEAVINYEDNGSALMYVYLMDDGPLAEAVTSKIAFLLTHIEEDNIVDRWVERFSKNLHEKYRLERLIDVLENTMDETVAERLIFFINISIKNHLTLFKRKAVESCLFI